jgi:hypothetical protein
VRVLCDHPMPRVRIPSSKKFVEYQEMVRNCHKYLWDVWCNMDGLKLMLEQSGDGLMQEQYYNGWTHDHYVTSVLCFCPDGTIPIAFINIPGAVHDSQVADYGDIHEKLKFAFDRDGAKCIVDSAFGNVTKDFLIRS